MVTVEALASGVPVIASKSGGSIEILEHGKLGKLYTPDNIEDFNQKIESLLVSEEERQKCAREGIRIVREKYDKSLMCKEIGKLLQ